MQKKNSDRIMDGIAHISSFPFALFVFEDRVNTVSSRNGIKTKQKEIGLAISNMWTCSMNSQHFDARHLFWIFRSSLHMSLVARSKIYSRTMHFEQTWLSIAVDYHRCHYNTVIQVQRCALWSLFSRSLSAITIIFVPISHITNIFILLLCDLNCCAITCGHH